MITAEFAPTPNTKGFFGEYGGQLIPPKLKATMDQIGAANEELRVRQDDQDDQVELAELYANYVGRPSRLYLAKRPSQKLGGAQIYLSSLQRCTNQTSAMFVIAFALHQWLSAFAHTFTCSRRMASLYFPISR